MNGDKIGMKDGYDLEFRLQHWTPPSGYIEMIGVIAKFAEKYQWDYVDMLKLGEHIIKTTERMIAEDSNELHGG